MSIKAFRWYGGKLRVVNTLNFLIPEHDSYYEPFMGASSVLLNHPRSSKEVINDLDSDLVCFMRTLADREKGKELTKQLESLEFSEDTFKKAKLCEKDGFLGLSDIERAVMVFIIISQSRNATRKSFGKGAYYDTYAYQSDIRRNIFQVYERLKNVEILEENGIGLLQTIVGDENAFAFVDPPYCHELRGKGATNIYKSELPQEEQIRLLETIRHAKCKILLCGYKSETGVDFYDSYLLPYGWHCYKLAELTKSCQNKAHRDKGKEFIWVNYKLPERARYMISLQEYRSC